MRQKHSFKWLEFGILLVAIIATFLVCDAYDVAEEIHQFSQTHESWQLDEIIVTIAISFLYYV